MPRVMLLAEDRLEYFLRKNFTQQELSDILDIPRSSVCKRLATMNFTYPMLRKIFAHTNLTAEQKGAYF